MNQRPPVCETGALPTELSACVRSSSRRWTRTTISRFRLSRPAVGRAGKGGLRNPRMAAAGLEPQATGGEPRGPEPSRLRRDAIASRRSRLTTKSPRGESNPCRQLGRLVPSAIRPLERREHPAGLEPQAAGGQPEATGGQPATFALAARYSDRLSYECGSPAGESNSALRVKGPLHHASMLAGRTSKVRLGGLEPPCSRISDGRLDRLSYRRSG